MVWVMNLNKILRIKKEKSFKIRYWHHKPKEERLGLQRDSRSFLVSPFSLTEMKKVRSTSRKT
jgi:hypothetical protein